MLDQITLEIKDIALKCLQNINLKESYEANKNRTCRQAKKTSAYNVLNFFFLPSVLNPGLEVNFATSTIFTANCCPVSLLIHRRTTLKGPLKHTHTKNQQ